MVNEWVAAPPSLQLLNTRYVDVGGALSCTCEFCTTWAEAPIVPLIETGTGEETVTVRKVGSAS